MKRTIIYYLLGLIFYFSHFTVFAQQSKPSRERNRIIDSLFILLKTDKPDTNKLIHLNKLSWEYNKIGSYDSTMLYANSALQLCNVMLKYATGTRIKKIIQKCKATSYRNIGIVYSEQGNYPEALKNFFASLKILETIGDKKGIASSYNNIGLVYFNQENFPESLKNHLASLKIREALGDKEGIASSYNNIGNIYFSQGNYPEALKNHFVSLKIEETTRQPDGQVGNKSGIADSYNNIGAVYEHQGNYPEALKNYLASLKIFETISVKAGIAASYCNIGNVYIKQKKYHEAEEYLNKAKEMSKKIGYKDCLRSAYSSLTNLDSAKGNFKGAYENHKLFILYRDSLDNEETRKKTIQSQMTFDFEKKEAVASSEHKKELENQQVLAEEKSRKQKIVIGFVCGSKHISGGGWYGIILRTNNSGNS